MDLINEDERFLELTDAFTNKVYRVVVSNEDYERALIDQQFANALLFHARVNNLEANDHMNSTVISDLEGPGDDDSGPSTSKGVAWSYDASCRLISSMGNHYNDFNNPKKRKHIFEMICNDLISEGFTVSSAAVQNKWKGLVRSYNKAKDTKTRTGMGPSRFHFYEQMDEILGNKPKNLCSHSLNSLKERSAEVSSDQENINPGTPEPSSSLTDNINERVVPENSGRRKKFSELQFKKNYMEMKKKEYDRRQKRHEEYVALENRKIALLEELINLKKRKRNGDN